jgi:hypothetical protein
MREVTPYLPDDLVSKAQVSDFTPRGCAFISWALERTAITQNPSVCVGSCHERSELLLIGKVPGDAGNMGAHTLVVVPHELPVCPRLGGPTAGPRERLVETGGAFNACTIRQVHTGKRRQEAGLAALCPGWPLGPGGAAHVLPKGQRTCVHPLRQGCRRHRNLPPERRGLCDPWRQRGLRLPPSPKGATGQKALARSVRRALDTTGATGRRFDLCGGRTRCSHREHAERLFSPGSLLAPGQEKHPMSSYHWRETAGGLICSRG